MENRIFSRVKVGYPARIEVKNERGNLVFETSGEIIDLSERGLGLITQKLLPQMPIIFLEIDPSPKYPKVATKAKVIWNISDSKSKKFRYGVYCMSRDEDTYIGTIRRILNDCKKGCFLFELTVYLKDTNVFGNAYFARYFEWQGMAREAYFQTVKDYENIMASGTKLITKSASIEYEHECYVFDEILMKLQNRNIKKCSFVMVFTYINKRTGKIIARGEETLVFADKNGKLTRIPQGILDVIINHPVD